MFERLSKFARETRGALIIGASIIIAFNFPIFLSAVADVAGYFESAWLDLTGETERQKKEFAKIEEQARLESEQNRIALEEIKKEIAEKARDRKNRKILLGSFWNEFLQKNRNSKNHEIEIKKDERIGDYMCLQFKGWDSEERSLRKDHYADLFIQWLNSRRALGSESWAYKNLDSDEFSEEPGVKEAIFAPAYKSCIVPRELYRVNRYEKRIE